VYVCPWKRVAYLVKKYLGSHEAGRLITILTTALIGSHTKINPFPILKPYFITASHPHLCVPDSFLLPYFTIKYMNAFLKSSKSLLS
jgi:hypothetical protein